MLYFQKIASQYDHEMQYSQITDHQEETQNTDCHNTI